jgi:hypothetical protein
MSETVLLRFLGSGLVDVGGDDAKLGKLQATSTAIALMLKKTPSKVPNYSLVAFDSNAPSADPVVVEVLNTLKELWPTYVNTFASTPITVIRAINALRRAVAKETVEHQRPFPHERRGHKPGTL